MRRLASGIPLTMLAIAAAVLLSAGIALRDSTAARRDRDVRRAFAAAVKRGERPEVATRNLAAILEHELTTQDRVARDARRLAVGLQIAGALSLVALGLALRSRRPRASDSMRPAAA